MRRPIFMNGGEIPLRRHAARVILLFPKIGSASWSGMSPKSLAFNGKARPLIEFPCQNAYLKSCAKNETCSGPLS